MNDIRIIPEEDFDRFFDIFLDAYPGIHSGAAEEKEKLKPRLFRRHDDPRISLYGLYRNGELLGGMRHFDFDMNLHGVKMLTGGIGCVAVDLMRKREHVARDLLQFFGQHYRDRGAPVTSLWSFRPDFYKQMGYGMGTRINVFEVKPEHFPKGDSKAHVRFLTKDDIPALNDCYNRFVDRHHGMIEETQLAREIAWELGGGRRWVGFVKDGRVRGYLAFRFAKGKHDSFVDNQMHIMLAVYEGPEVLSELLTFLHSQFDQIELVNVRTFDDNFHHLLKDPRNSRRDLIPSVYHETHKSATGIMYRVVDVRKLFELLPDHNFGGQSCRFKLTMRDSFMPVNDGSVVLHFENGKVRVMPDDAEFDVELSMDVADFSSLVMGAVDLRSLYDYGLASLSDQSHVDTLHKLFATDARPICTTDF